MNKTSQREWIARHLQLVIHDRSVRAALSVFALTRAIVFIIFILATNITILEPNRVFIRDANETRISLSHSGVARRLRPLVQRADCAWYLGIARNGYEQRSFDDKQERNWAFFPLFPLMWRLASKITGGFELTGIWLSNIFFLAALFILHKNVGAFGFDEQVADRTVFYVAIFPTSYFFSLPMTESLFLLLIAGSFLAAKSDRWWLAGIIGAFATATRSSGMILLPSLLLLYWQTERRFKPQAKILSLLLIPAGLLAFMFHLRLITGNALAFKDVLVAWNRRPAFFLRPLLDYVFNPLELSFGWDFRMVNFASAMTAFACGFALLKRREWALALFTLASVIMPLSAPALPLQSLTRYVMVIFPIFIMLAVAGGRPRVDQTIRAAFLVALGLMTFLYAIHVTLAMS